MKYRIVPCHCNGSRGTDCDYCGGSGKKKVPIAEVNRSSKRRRASQQTESFSTKKESENLKERSNSPAASGEPKKEPKLFITALTEFINELPKMEPSQSNLQMIQHAYDRLCKMEDQFYNKTFHLTKKQIKRNASILNIYFELIYARDFFLERFGKLKSWPKRNSLQQLYQFISLENDGNKQKKTIFKTKKNKKPKKTKPEPPQKKFSTLPKSPTLGDKFSDAFSYFRTLINLQGPRK